MAIPAVFAGAYLACLVLTLPLACLLALGERPGPTRRKEFIETAFLAPLAFAVISAGMISLYAVPEFMTQVFES